jgi:hypothetical protein
LDTKVQPRRQSRFATSMSDTSDEDGGVGLRPRLERLINDVALQVARVVGFDKSPAQAAPARNVAPAAAISSCSHRESRFRRAQVRASAETASSPTAFPLTGNPGAQSGAGASRRWLETGRAGSFRREPDGVRRGFEG